MSPTSNLPDSSARQVHALPKWARLLDAIVLGLLLVALFVALGGGYRGTLFGIAVSVRSPDRALALALLLAAVRHWLVRRPTLWERVEAYLQRAPAWARVDVPLAPDEVRLFADRSVSPFRRIGELLAVTTFYAATVCVATYPQAVRLDAVPDLGDPLFSTWRLAWVAHQLPRDPLHLFDANIFHPERLTFTYSDAMIVPALAAAPFLWLGAHPLHMSNLLLLAALTLSGVTMFVLVRSLTGRPEAGLLAGTLFALYPYRFEHYAHLELQMTFWMPLLLLAVHRAFARGGRVDGLLAGVLWALQTLSSLYYGLFVAAYALPLGVALGLQSPVRRRAMISLARGAVVAVVLVAPVIAVYAANRTVVGERDASEVQLYSARPQDYLQPAPRSPYFEWWQSRRHHAERELFPTITPVALALVGVCPPLSAARIGYALALVVSFEASLGMNSGLYDGLRSMVPPYRGLRAPARFSIMVGLALVVLAGYGAARLTRSLSPALRALATAALLGVALFELTPRLQLQPVWRQAPAIYERLAGPHPVVLAEFPMPEPARPDDGRATYFSIFHWRPIVNGISGHYPRSYIQLLARMREFPSEAALAYLRHRGVTHLAIHGAFYGAERYAAIVRALDGRRDVALVSRAPFARSESRLYELRR